jgi:hypothetical protein
LLHVALTAHIDIGYAIVRIDGYLSAPNTVIFEGLEHTMHYLYVYRYISIIYRRCPLNKKSLAIHWGKGSVEYLSPEYITILVHTVDADHSMDICDLRSFTPSIHILNGVVIAWKCKKQAVTTLHFTGSEIPHLLSQDDESSSRLAFQSRLSSSAPMPTFEENL